jgi:hypothetical protein
MIIKQAALGLVEFDTAVTLGEFLVIEDDIIVLLTRFLSLLGVSSTNLDHVGMRHIRNLRLLLLLLKLDRAFLHLLAHLRTHL